MLKKFTSPEELAEVDLSELTAFLNEHSRGRLDQNRAEQIKSLAKGTFGVNLALDAFTLGYVCLLNKLILLKIKSVLLKKLLVLS